MWVERCKNSILLFSLILPLSYQPVGLWAEDCGLASAASRGEGTGKVGVKVESEDKKKKIIIKREREKERNDKERKEENEQQNTFSSTHNCSFSTTPRGICNSLFLARRLCCARGEKVSSSLDKAEHSDPTVPHCPLSLQ